MFILVQHSFPSWVPMVMLVNVTGSDVTESSNDTYIPMGPVSWHMLETDLHSALVHCTCTCMCVCVCTNLSISVGENYNFGRI